MRTPELERLAARADDVYVRIRLGDGHGTETARLLSVQPVSEEERNYGYAHGAWVHVRRFLLGGPRDIRVYPREVEAQVQPKERTLRVFAICEEAE